MKFKGKGVVLVLPCFNEERWNNEPYRSWADVEDEFLRMAKNSFLFFIASKAKGSEMVIDIEDPASFRTECHVDLDEREL